MYTYVVDFTKAVPAFGATTTPVSLAKPVSLVKRPPTAAETLEEISVQARLDQANALSVELRAAVSLAEAEAVQLRVELCRAQELLRSAQQRNSTLREAHEQDIERIGRALIEQADSRDWCSEYDEIVKSLNRRLNVPLPTREKDYTVTFTVTVSVTAVGRDEAREMANEMMSNASYGCSGSFDYDCESVDED